jgi:hypothetical protein
MPHILGQAQGQARSTPFRLTLNTDGRPHTVENTLALTALALGLVGFVAGVLTNSGAVPLAHVVASWAGAAGFGTGLFSQYVSATTPERCVNIVAIVASFLGAALGIANGGFL